MELYHNGMAVCAQKVRLALAEKGLTFESHLLDLRKGETHTPEYLKLNPNGVVPTLIVDGTPIIESTIINEYIEDNYSEPSLKPSNPFEVARMRNWVMKTDSGLLKICAGVSFAIAFGKQEQSAQLASRTEEERQATIERNKAGLSHPDARNALKSYVQFIKEVATHLESHKWLAGDTFSLAECAIVPYVRRLEDLNQQWIWENGQGYTGFIDWYERCKARASFKTAIIDWAPPPVLDLMKTTGTESRTIAEEVLAS